MEELLSLQGSIFLLMIAGLVMKKTGIVGETGQKNMTDLVLNLILPCNIIRSFQIEFSWKTMHSFGTILVVSICIQLGCMVLGKLLFGRMSRNKWKCLYYGTVCSNAGFLGILSLRVSSALRDWRWRLFISSLRGLSCGLRESRFFQGVEM